MKNSLNDKKNRIIVFIFLHMLLMVYSFTGVFTKLAAGQIFLSLQFFIYYGFVIMMLGVYAMGWQQVIKRLPLTTAFANKAITIAWGMLWGVLFFKEKVSIGNLIGAAIVIVGVVMYVKADSEMTDTVNDKIDCQDVLDGGFGDTDASKEVPNE